MSTIKFTNEKSRLDNNLSTLEGFLTSMDTQVTGAAKQLNAALDWFWNRPDEEIEEILNFYGPVGVQQVFGQHAEKAAMLNAILSTRGLPQIAKIGAQKEVAVDPDTGMFSVVPLSESLANEAITSPDSLNPEYYEDGNQDLPEPDGSNLP